MVNQRSRGELTEQHKEDRVSHAKARCNPCDREHIESDKQPSEKQMLGLCGRFGKGAGAACEKEHEHRRRQRDAKKNGASCEGRAEACPEAGVEGCEHGDAEACGEHDKDIDRCAVHWVSFKRDKMWRWRWRYLCPKGRRALWRG